MLKIKNEILNHGTHCKNVLIIGPAGSGKTHLIEEIITDILENSDDLVVVHVPRKEYKLENVSEELQKKIRFKYMYDNSKNSDESIPENSWFFCDEFENKNYNMEGAEYFLLAAKENNWNVVMTVQSANSVPEKVKEKFTKIYIL